MERNFSPWAATIARLDRRPPREPIPDDPVVARERVAALRARLLDALGPDPIAVEPRTEVGPPVDEPYGRRRRVVFDTEAHLSVPAWLLEPEAPVADGAAVLVVHGHGLDKDRVCGVDGPSAAAYGRALAEAGFTVLAPDLRGFGERADGLLPGPTPGDLADEIVHHQADCGWDLVCALIEGTTPLARNLWDLRRCLDVLAALAGVDPGRLGVVGWSYGATLALFLSAIDRRVAAVVASGFLSSWPEAHRVPWNLCGRQVLPGMLDLLDHPDLAALVAPRPLLVESGAEDRLFPVVVARRSVGEARAAYDALGADPAALVHDVVPGGHAWDGRGVPGFLARHLRGPSDR